MRERGEYETGEGSLFMVSACQSGSLHDDIRRWALPFVCHVAIGTDGALARDAPGIAHFETMTARDRPVPKLISLSAQHFHARNGRHRGTLTRSRSAVRHGYSQPEGLCDSGQ
jgi:hypothetical protein